MNVGLVVTADVALVVARADSEDRLEEGDEFGSGVAAVKVEVYAVVALADEEALGMGLMAEDKLLKEEKSALMGDVLADLHVSAPLLRVELGLGAVVTHRGLHLDLRNKGLLEDSASECFALDGEAELQATRVGLGPDEADVNEAQMLQPSDARHA
jgi:hypothetical protein